MQTAQNFSPLFGTQKLPPEYGDMARVPPMTTHDPNYELFRHERLARLLAGRPHVRLETNENGCAIVDKEKHPRLYDWAVNG